MAVDDNTLLLAIAALLARQSEPSDRDPRTAELLLSDVGLGYKDIAAIVGKQPDAVRVGISRARARR